jgi:hypothetical protein
MNKLYSALFAILVVSACPVRALAWRGACCLPDGTCVEDQTPPECDELGGQFKGIGVDCDEVDCAPADLVCRVTGGGVDTDGQWDGGMARGRSETDRYTFGGQAGAPTAEQPQPWGEWTHHQQNGPSGRFVFHAGTASAPPGTEIDVIECSDPGFCSPARPAPAKQIDFEGVGTFKNIRTTSPELADVVPGVTMHRFEVHIEDLGEPGHGQHQDPPDDACPAEGSAGSVASCDCPDFYSITIYATEAGADVIYEVHGYVTHGNLQIHPAI